ncbi:zinc-dependent metalloprotease [Dactylosporangium sp. CA-233914]|uniref:zinc-dependent metalloprotease n=1 Tax=Dactylosporangium sp. CA-233914 TaxID=3239934 RepID=UPI003D8D0AC3
MAGSLLLEIRRLDTDFLFTAGLATGLGSPDILLDRQRNDVGHVVRFERTGPRVLLIEQNTYFRSRSTDPEERRAVADSFARSVLWGFPVVAESPDAVLVEATSFLLSDVPNVAKALTPGGYRVDPTRSSIYLPGTKAFPRNTEIEATLTYVADDVAPLMDFGPPIVPASTDRAVPRPAPGLAGEPLLAGTIESIAPRANVVTLRAHVSLVELPGDDFEPRHYDPRSGYVGFSFLDFGAGVGEREVTHLIRRHRLQKKDPAAAVSDPVEPLRYCVDRGAPPDVREAIIEGVRWWLPAFEAAGFSNAIEGAVLPEDADPMDMRYHMITWTHRSHRSWSRGATVDDPRTGEILKANVSLGSMREHQEFRLIEALTAPFPHDESAAEARRAAMARITRTAAHEVGHTLGLAHNFYASSHGYISVMDYSPLDVRLRVDGSIEVMPRAVCVGEWDLVAIRYGYGDLPVGEAQPEALAAILDQAWERDLRFFTNQDQSVHPRVRQWSSGVDQADELRRLMAVRRAALDRLGEATIRPGAFMATLEEALVPVYLLHRFTTEAAASLLGGQEFAYARRGDGLTPITREPASNQRRALAAILATLAPAELTIPAAVLDLIPPRPFGFGLTRDHFPRTTGATFDPITPAAVAADLTVAALLAPDRAARLVAQHAIDPDRPGLAEVLDKLIETVAEATTASPYEAEVRRAVERVLVDRLAWLGRVAPNGQVRAVALANLAGYAERLRTLTSAGSGEREHHAYVLADIERHLAAPATVVPAHPTPAPPVSADTGQRWLDHP